MPMFHDLNQLLKTWGYLALLSDFLEGETILIVAGVLASRGRLNLHYAIRPHSVAVCLVTSACFFWRVIKALGFSKNLVSGMTKSQRLEAFRKEFYLAIDELSFFYGLEMSSPLPQV